MSQDSLVAVYESLDEARLGIECLQRGGHPAEKISLVAHHLKPEQREVVSHGDKTERLAGAGAAAGGTIGLLAGSTLLAIPGVGPVVAAGAIATGMTGAVVGALVGAMSGWGIPEDHYKQYESQLAEGKLLVLAHGHPDELAEAQRLLQDTQPLALRMHAEVAADDLRIAQD